TLLLLGILTLWLLGCGSLRAPWQGPVDAAEVSSGTPLPWTLVVLPDTQAVTANYPDIFDAQTAWVAANASQLNILYVAHEGDITNDSSDEQWSAATHSLHVLDGIVPYALALGNHDYPGSGGVTARDSTQFDRYFPLSDLEEGQKVVGLFQPGSASNAAYAFKAGAQDWLIVALEFGPRDSVLAWANDVLKQHAGSNAIVLTHAYLNVDGMRQDYATRTDEPSDPHEYDSDGRLGGVNDGEEIWQKLILHNPNVRIVLCGHMHAQASLTSLRQTGLPVYQLLADFQNEELGGGGYLRIMTFRPDGVVSVRTYSPHYRQYRTELENEFELSL
ncbi:MAG TPA: metallophosphoesterase, partial [Polyangia bacterium]